MSFKSIQTNVWTNGPADEIIADNQPIATGGKDDADSMLRKLQEELVRWGLVINIRKTEYMVIGDQDQNDDDMHVGMTPWRYKQYNFAWKTRESST